MKANPMKNTVRMTSAAPGLRAIPSCVPLRPIPMPMPHRPAAMAMAMAPILRVEKSVPPAAVVCASNGEAQASRARVARNRGRFFQDMNAVHSLAHEMPAGGGSRMRWGVTVSRWTGGTTALVGFGQGASQVGHGQDHKNISLQQRHE